MARPSASPGMTLVELLVVIAIIGAMIISVGLSIGLAGDRGAKSEAVRLATALESFSLQARSSGRTLAWSHSGATYRFWQRDTDGGWLVLSGSPDFAQRQLPAGTRITTVTVDGQELAADQRLVFSLTPPLFQIALGEGDQAYRLNASPSGRVRVESVTRTAEKAAFQ